MVAFYKSKRLRLQTPVSFILSYLVQLKMQCFRNGIIPVQAIKITIVNLPKAIGLMRSILPGCVIYQSKGKQGNGVYLKTKWYLKA